MDSLDEEAPPNPINVVQLTPPPPATANSTVRKLEVRQAVPASPGGSAPPSEFPRRPGIARIDLKQLARSGYLVPAKARSEVAEEFRHIKRPLLKNIRTQPEDGRNSLIMITSALAGEGKTFCAINLAISMAMEIDTSVLLVDADVIRPSVPTRLGIKAGRGLLDVLEYPSLDVSEVIFNTNVPKLSVLFAGTPNSRSTELLASDAMDCLLKELSRRYSDHVIIFDAPPLLLTSEARVLAARVGQVVIVVNGSRTPRSIVARAFAAVENCSNVASVLNRCYDPNEMRPYGYYYQ